MKKARITPYVVDIDKPILIAYLGLAFMGLLTMLNITSVQGSMSYFYRHIGFLAISMLITLFVVIYPNLEKLKFLNSSMIFISIILLSLVLVVGANIKGATRMLRLGPLSFQPSFLARLALIFFYSSYIAKKQEELREANLKKLLISFMPVVSYTALIYILILVGKHLSTLVISGTTLLSLLFYAGIRKRFVAAAVIIGLLAGVAILTLGPDYRGKRIDIYRKYNLFFKSDSVHVSEADDYQVRESLTALSSGGLIGTGIARGRAKHYYLPEARTDYVFTIIGEEFGFIGALLVLGLHCILFFRAFRIADKQESFYLKLLCVGLAMNIFYNALVNIGVSISIIPPTGNTLPFVSYGGSALLMDSLAVGVILNISATRRYV